MSCEDFHEHLSALLDGELPKAEAAALAAHLAACPGCARHLQELANLRAAMAGLEDMEVSPRLEARILALTGSAPGPAKILPLRPRWRQFGLLAATAGLAAMLILALRPADKTPDFLAVRDATLRGWLTPPGNAGAPMVPGFTLIGTREDEVAGHQALVADYARNGTRFTLCAWAAGSEPARNLREAIFRGTAINYWNDGREEYWVASPAPAPALPDFVQALRASVAPGFN